jgi:hypothetical protein
MDSEISLLDQYKMLREEVMQYMRETYNTQVAAAIAAASVYAWLLLHKKDVPSRAVWFIAPCVILVGALRSFELTLRIRSIASYLRRIEEVACGTDTQLPGWEHFKSAHRWIDISANVWAIIIWGLEFVGSIAASWYFSQ